MSEEQEPKGRVGGASWSVDDISFDTIDPSLIHDNSELFYLLAAASFIEITSDLYTKNLIEFYSGNPEIENWLANFWELEEVQHGAVLKRYVMAVWPEFDWERAYLGFVEEYARTCTMDNLAENRALGDGRALCGRDRHVVVLSHPLGSRARAGAERDHREYQLGRGAALQALLSLFPRL